jgi:enediyne biosynthesis protein E4
MANVRTSAFRIPRSAFVAVAPVVALVLLASHPARPSAQRGLGFQLVDITAQAGIRFDHHTGAFGQKWLPETMGPGAAFLDFDGNGWQDILLVNGMDWPGHRTTLATSRLFRNNGDGTFTDVTAGSGLDVEIYGMGAAVADFDNDGRPDILITAVGQNRLFRNLGGGRFEDVTEKAGLAGRESFSTSAMWFDYDRDGHLDLLVANYVRWSPETDVFCSVDGKEKAYCTPEMYRGTTSWLFRNRGDGTFEDVTAKAGLFDATSKSLGVTMLDYDGDGWPDVFIANDTEPNKLYRNNRDGTFTELGLHAGLAFGEEGKARAGMGVDAAVVDGTGRPAVAVTNFSGEMVGLWKPDESGQYVDRAPQSEVGRVTRQTLGWGCFFFDVDLDGQLDLLVVNGHIDDTFARVQSGVRYAEPPHLFRNLGAGRFVDVAAEVGPDFVKPKVGRGAAFADIDNDGDLDVLVTTNSGPAYLYRTDLLNGHSSIRFRLQGTRSNRDGIGAVVRVTVGTDRFEKMVRTGSSYLSQSELPVTFGLGDRRAVDLVRIEWPSGVRQEFRTLEAGHLYEVVEGKGLTPRPYGPGVRTSAR